MTNQKKLDAYERMKIYKIKTNFNETTNPIEHLISSIETLFVQRYQKVILVFRIREVLTGAIIKSRKYYCCYSERLQTDCDLSSADVSGHF